MSACYVDLAGRVYRALVLRNGGGTERELWLRDALAVGIRWRSARRRPVAAVDSKGIDSPPPSVNSGAA